MISFRYCGVLFFLQVSPKLLSWNTVVGSKEVQESSVYLHFFLFNSRENVAKNKGGLVGVPCGSETRLRVWYSMFSRSPVRQQVPDHVCKKSIDTTIDSQQTIIFEAVCIKERLSTCAHTSQSPTKMENKETTI